MIGLRVFSTPILPDFAQIGVKTGGEGDGRREEAHSPSVGTFFCNLRNYKGKTRGRFDLKIWAILRPAKPAGVTVTQCHGTRGARGQACSLRSGPA